MSLQKIKDEILKTLKVPVFPDRSFDVTAFGADGSGKRMRRERYKRRLIKPTKQAVEE